MRLQETELEGKVALITGAASGVGKATALSFARAGAKVALLDVNAEALAETAAEITALGYYSPLTLVIDLSVGKNCEKAVGETIKKFGRLDALCNVAGILLVTRFKDMSVEQWQKVMSVNLTAPALLIKAALPELERNDGAIVNVASAAAITGHAYLSAYGATKAAIVNLTKSLAMEYIKTGVRINAIAPGGMSTNMVEEFQVPEGADEELIQRIGSLRGNVPVEEVADLISFLCSARATGFHGACINIDAGITAD